MQFHLLQKQSKFRKYLIGEGVTALSNSFKMKIGIPIISHKRPKIDKCFCLMVDRLMNDYPGLFLPVCVVSLEEDKAVFEEHGIETHLYKNNPVGEKHNYCLSLLKDKCSHVFHIGSDDLVDNNYMNELIKFADKDIVWGRGLVFYSVRRKMARFWEEPFKNFAGPNKLISARLLDKLDWHIWDDDIDKGLDHSSSLKLLSMAESKHIIMIRSIGGLFVDIKGETNINGFEKYINNGREIGIDHLRKRLPANEWEYLKSLN